MLNDQRQARKSKKGLSYTPADRASFNAIFEVFRIQYNAFNEIGMVDAYYAVLKNFSQDELMTVTEECLREIPDKFPTAGQMYARLKTNRRRTVEYHERELRSKDAPTFDDIPLSKYGAENVALIRKYFSRQINNIQYYQENKDLAKKYNVEFMDIEWQWYKDRPTEKAGQRRMPNG